MISFDCDNLGRRCDLFFSFFFSRRFPRLAVDSPIYASNKHFVTSQFILIAPLCQPAALMILRCTLHSSLTAALLFLNCDGTPAQLCRQIKLLFICEKSRLHKMF